MSSEHGATVDGDGDDKAIESEAKPVSGVEQLKFAESSQSTDNFFDWIKVANHAFDSGDLENAKQCYLRALEHCDDADQSGRLICLNRLGEICLSLNQPDVAFRVFAQSLPRNQDSSKVALQRNVLNIAVIISAILTCFSFNLPSSSVTVGGTGDESATILSTKSSIAAATKRNSPSDRKFISPVQVGAEFKSGDQMHTLKVTDAENVYQWDNGDIWGAKYVSPSFTLSDVFKLLRGCRKRSTHFIITASDYLVDDDGVIFYTNYAPEVKVVERMWWYHSFFNSYYDKFRRYPTREEPWMNTVEGYTYTNAFTGISEKASFVTVADPAAAPPEVAKPGAILIITNQSGSICTICGYDRNSRLLNTSAKKALLLRLRGGVNIAEQESKVFQTNPELSKTHPPETIVFIHDPVMKTVLKGAETYIPAFAIPVWLASLTLSLFFYRVFLKSEGRILAFSPLVVPSLLLFMVAFMSLGD